MRILSILTCLMLFSAASHGADDNVQKIKSDLQSMQTVLNNKDDVRALIRFFHEFIDQNAVFQIRLKNPAMEKAAHQSGAIEMDKADYINSFVMGTNFVEDYRADVTPLTIDFDGKEHVKLHFQIKETGKAKDPYGIKKTNQDFTSLSDCEAILKTDQGHFVITHSMCTTSVLFEEDV